MSRMRSIFRVTVGRPWVRQTCSTSSRYVLPAASLAVLRSAKMAVEELSTRKKLTGAACTQRSRGHERVHVSWTLGLVDLAYFWQVTSRLRKRVLRRPHGALDFALRNGLCAHEVADQSSTLDNTALLRVRSDSVLGRTCRMSSTTAVYEKPT